MDVGSATKSKGTATVDRPGDTFDHSPEVFRRRGYST